ncbi:MAG: acetylneuraminic acid synthetase [Rhodospirillaceae bacterium]|nr:MAG: acetylneuraminic acid synthetase [Rhodospirillaceae bacterium]
MTEIKLGKSTVRAGGRPYVIAEIGVNHEGSMDTAKRLIDLCKEGGADAAKFQTYKASRIASKHSPAYWDTSKEPTQSQHKLFQKYDMFGKDEYVTLAEHCQDVGIDFLSTPFDSDAADFLDPLLPFHKIASADLTNVPLLRQIAGKKKPVLLSTGASTLDEIDHAVSTLEKAGCQDLILLHCILNYPCPNENAHLDMIKGLRHTYPDTLIGYSDHTLPDERMLILTAAWQKGAVVLEKHFTHDKTLPGNDHYHAMDVHDLKRFIENVDLLTVVSGEQGKKPLDAEAPAREHARRSIVIDRPLKAGTVLDESDLTYKRPAHGISPLHWDEVVGRSLSTDLEEDHILQWEDLA